MQLKEVGVPSSTVLACRAENHFMFILKIHWGKNKQTENPSGDQNGEHVGVSKLETFASALNSSNLTQLAYGIAANVAAVLLYGTNFMPVKRIELGDGESLPVVHFRF